MRKINILLVVVVSLVVGLDCHKAQAKTLQTGLNLTIKSLKKEEAAKYGVSAPAVFGQLAGVLGESKLFSIDDQDVVFRIAEDKKLKSVEELRDLLIFTTKGSVSSKNLYKPFKVLKSVGILRVVKE